MRGVTRYMCITSVFLLIVVTIGVSPVGKAYPPRSEPQWPALGHDMHHTGLGDGNVSESKPNIIWKYDLGNISYASPTVDYDGTVYVDDYDGIVYAVNPDGTLKWSRKIGNSEEWSTNPITIGNGTLYFSSYYGTLYALDRDGNVLWSHFFGSTHDHLFSPIIGDDGTIYVTLNGGTGDDALYALYPNGTLKWKGDAYSPSTPPTLGMDGSIYYGSSTNYIYAYSPSGTLQWDSELSEVIQAAPVVRNDGRIYVGDIKMYFEALTPYGSRIWIMTFYSGVYAEPALGYDGTVYMGSGNITYAISNGNELWEYNPGSPVVGISVAHNGIILVASGKNLSALDSQGNVLWTVSFDGAIGSQPAIDANGRIYVVYSIGDHSVLACLGELPIPELPYTPVIFLVAVGIAITKKLKKN